MSDKQRYYWLKEHGICVNCGCENAVKGKTKCWKCRADASDRAALYYYHWHDNAAPEELAEYREKKRLSCHERYVKRRSMGLCVQCGKPSDWKSLCKRCNAKFSRWRHDSYMRKKAP